MSNRNVGSAATRCGRRVIPSNGSAEQVALPTLLGALFEHTTDFARLVTPMPSQRSDRVELPSLGPTRHRFGTYGEHGCDLGRCEEAIARFVHRHPCAVRLRIRSVGERVPLGPA
jgi:hypothetical protein